MAFIYQRPNIIIDRLTITRKIMKTKNPHHLVEGHIQAEKFLEDIRHFPLLNRRAALTASRNVTMSS
jgi:hypothetical protein